MGMGRGCPDSGGCGMIRQGHRAWAVEVGGRRGQDGVGVVVLAYGRWDG